MQNRYVFKLPTSIIVLNKVNITVSTLVFLLFGFILTRGFFQLILPKYISMAQLTDEVMTEAKSAIQEELASEGKPEHIWDKIVPGKMDRFVSDNTTLDQEMCLLDQDFIKEDNKNVAALAIVLQIFVMVQVKQLQVK